MFAATKLLAIAKECFVTVKLKPKMIVVTGSPRRRLLLTTTKAKVCFDEEKDDL